MSLGRRTWVLLTALAVLGAPALVLRTLCLGHSCDEPARASAEVPFCSLPAATRSLISEGFREGRSAEILAVARTPGLAGSTGAERRAPWPASGDHPETRVPLVFAGAGVTRDATIPAETTLDSVAPTQARIARFDRPFPGVRSGRPVPGVAGGPPARLLVTIVLKGIGSEDLERNPEQWSRLRRVMGAWPSTLDARTGSLPVDPAAILSTIGTGGLPRQHGVTGSLIRDDDGRLVSPFSDRAPTPVIATLADDLDEATRGRARIGLVASSASDRGLVGGDWYPGGDRDEVVLDNRGPAAAARILTSGYGRDDATDLLAVVLDGRPDEIDEDLGRLLAVVPDDAALAITATGGGLLLERKREPEDVVGQVERSVETRRSVVEGVVPGGVFTDQRTLAAEELSEDEITTALGEVRAESGALLFDDVFPALAVSFARYC